MTKVGVIRGGRSLEREFSLRSGQNVASALGRVGHEVTLFDVDERLTAGMTQMDAVFIALHGRDGEDGRVQAICEALGLAYTGSDPVTCQRCFDKVLAKHALSATGVAVPRGFDLSAEAVRGMGAGPALRAASERIGYPLVVKPVEQGSSLGLVVVDDPQDLPAAAMESFQYADRILIEEFIEGDELAISVIGGDLTALPAVQIELEGRVFDFEARHPAPTATFHVPPVLDQSVVARAETVARHAALTLGVRDFARVDLRICKGEPVVLEINPCPGLTETSLLPMALALSATTFDVFVAEAVQAALTR